MNLKEVLSNEDKVLGSYRRDVSRLLPKAARVAWSLKKTKLKRRARYHPQEISLQFIQSQLPEKLGEGLSAPHVLGKGPRLLVRILPKFQPAQGAAAPHAHAGNGKTFLKRALTHRWIGTGNCWEMSPPASRNCRMIISIPAVSRAGKI